MPIEAGPPAAGPTKGRPESGSDRRQDGRPDGAESAAGHGGESGVERGGEDDAAAAVGGAEGEGRRGLVPPQVHRARLREQRPAGLRLLWQRLHPEARRRGHEVHHGRQRAHADGSENQVRAKGNLDRVHVLSPMRGCAGQQWMSVIVELILDFFILCLYHLFEAFLTGVF